MTGKSGIYQFSKEGTNKYAEPESSCWCSEPLLVVPVYLGVSLAAVRGKFLSDEWAEVEGEAHRSGQRCYYHPACHVHPVTVHSQQGGFCRLLSGALCLIFPACLIQDVESTSALEFLCKLEK